MRLGWGFGRRLATRVAVALRRLGTWQIVAMAAMAVVLFAVGGLTSITIAIFIQRSTASTPRPATHSAPPVPAIATASPPMATAPAASPTTANSPDLSSAPVPTAVPTAVPIPVPSSTREILQTPNPPLAAAMPSVAPSAQPPALSLRITSASYGYLAASTSPGATCTARARWPWGDDRNVQGLQGNRVADAAGSVSWSYTTSPQATSGTGTYFVTCTADGGAQTARATFTIP